MGGRQANQDNRQADGRKPGGEAKTAPAGKTGSKPLSKSKRR
jgi:hypothetical protein